MTECRFHKGHVLGVAAFLAFPLAIFASKALTPLFVAAAVIGLATDFLDQRRLPRLPRPFAVLFALVVAWGLLSALWSITPGRSLYLNLPLAGTYLGGLVLVSLAVRLRPDERRFFETALVAGFALGTVMLAIEIMSPLALTSVIFPLIRGNDIGEFRDWIYGLPGYHLPNFFKHGTMMAMLLVWPAIAILWRRGARIFASALMAAVLLLLILSTNGSSIFGLAVGLGALAISFMARAKACWVFAAVVALGIGGAPVAIQLIPNNQDLARMLPNLPDSVFSRFFVWRNVADLIAEAPVQGKGLDTSRAISPDNERIRFIAKGGELRDSVVVPLHPHNAVLQVWLELGAVGALLLLAIMLAMIRRISVNAGGRMDRAICFGAVFSALSIANLSYGIWQSWWQGTLWLLAAFVAGTMPGASREKTPAEAPATAPES